MRSDMVSNQAVSSDSYKAGRISTMRCTMRFFPLLKDDKIGCQKRTYPPIEQGRELLHLSFVAPYALDKSAFVIHPARMRGNRHKPDSLACGVASRPRNS